MDWEIVIEEIRLVREDVQDLREELYRYKGFAGGVAWCLSALAALAGFVWGVVTSHG